MKLTFDIQYMNESKAFGVAAHNRRDESHIKGNKSDEQLVGGIDVSKSSNNNIRIDDFRTIDALLENRKVIGGKQKVADEYCGFVIQIGNKDKHMDKAQNKEFFVKTHDWMTRRFGDKYILQSIEHWDEVTPKIKILMANVTDYEGSDVRKAGKVYIGAKRRFGTESAQNRRDVQEMYKDFQKAFYGEVCKPFEAYGLEAPSEQIGTRGKKSQAYFIQEKNNEARLEAEQLKAKTQELVDKVNKILVDYKALAKVAGKEKWSELMQELKREKELEQQKLRNFKKGREK